MILPLHQAILKTSRSWRVQAYVVGGPVRDRLLGRPYQDLDIATPQAAEMAKRFARQFTAKFITLDPLHKIYRVIIPSSQSKKVGQLTTVDFAELQGKTIEEDLARRDFTVNAMASPVGEDLIIDPWNGQRDLKRRKIVAVSQAAFKEDPLRLLRAFRFSAQLDFPIERQTLRWIIRDRRLLLSKASSQQGELPEIPEVARERIREELLRLLSHPFAAPKLEEMDRCGLLTVIFPPLEAGRKVALSFYGKGGVITHALQTVANLEWLFGQMDNPKNLKFIPNPTVGESIREYLQQKVGAFPRFALLKLGGLLHDVGKPATARKSGGRLRFFGHEDIGASLAKTMGEKLRFSHQECQMISRWVQNHMRPGNLATAPVITAKAIARFFRDLGEDGVGMLSISLGDHYTYVRSSLWGRGKDPVEQTTRRLLEQFYLQPQSVAPPKIIDGHILMKALKLRPGPSVGTLLERMHDAQVEGQVKTKEEALHFAKNQLRTLGTNS